MSSPRHYSDRRLPWPERFWAKVEKTDTCWLWAAATDGKGYGIVWAGTCRRAHRVSWELAGLELVDGMELDHLCRVVACVNPTHLEQVTGYENTIVRGVNCMGAVNLRKTHCPRGHEYTPENTYVWPGAPSGRSRQCRDCMKLGKRERLPYGPNNN